MALLTEENAAEYLPLLITDRSKQLRTVIDPDVLGSTVTSTMGKYNRPHQSDRHTRPWAL